MRRRSRAGGEKTRRRKTATLKRRNAPKAVSNRSVSVPSQETEVARLARELNEALERQTATAEILKIISASPTELQSVLEVVVKSAARFCEADDVTIFELDGQDLRAVAHWGPVSQDIGVRFPCSREHVVGRAVLERRPVHVIDLQAEAEEFPEGSAFAKRLGHRTILGAPLLREGMAVGTIALRRAEVHPFTDKQIALLETFAAQAVIAIENARLLNDLRESLERQTATADVLRIISSSPGDLQPVFSAMLESAARLCDASFGNIFRWDDDALRLVATYNTPAAFVEARSHLPLRRDQNNPIGEMLAAKTVLHVHDLTADERYINRRDPNIIAAVEQGGIRTFLAVPMLKDNELIGALIVYRQEVRPFSDKQIELVKNFAAQAVIAIENTRLLNELRQSLEQQTATADVLRVISSSPGDLEPVFQAMLENAVRICEAKFGMMALCKDGHFRLAAHLNVPSALSNFMQQRGTWRPPAGSAFERLLQTKSVFHTADVSAEQVPNPTAQFGGARAYVAVPMLKDDVLIGAISIYRQEVQPFTDKQIALVQNFAAQAVIAIENTRLLNELRQRTDDLSEALEQQTTTAEILGVISSSLGDAQPVFDAIVQSGIRLFSGAAVSIALVDNGMVKAAAVAERDPARAEAWRQVFPFPLSREYMHSAAILDRRMVDIPDVEKAPADMTVGGKNFPRSGYRAVTIMPLMQGETAIGALSVVRAASGPLSEKQLSALKTYANQAIIAIENARLLNELRQRTTDLTESLEQQTATSKVLEVISLSAFDLQAVFEAVAESSVRLCGADRAFIYRFDGELLRMAVALNAPQALKDFLTQNPMRPGRYSGAGRAALERQTIHIPDVLADPEYSYGSKDVEALRTVLSVPILKGNDLLGVVGIYTLEKVRPFTDKQIALVETFADQAAIAIDNVRLVDELCHRTDELSESLQQQTATADVLKLISRSTFDLESVLNTLVESAARLCEADTATIAREKNAYYNIVASYGFPPGFRDYVETVPLERGRGSMSGRVLLECKPVQVVDVLADPEYAMHELQKRAGYRTVLGVPLLREGVPIGLLNLNRTSVRAFTDKQIELVTTFADQAAIAIENVRLFDEIQDKSRQLEEASQHKSQFLANMSHELRTPLNAILGYTELMADGAYGEPSEKMLGILKRLEANGKHLLGLINDVLDLSKIEAGQLVLELSDYSVQDIAQTVRSTLEPLAADKKLAFKVEVAPQLPSGHGDGRRLTQVLINLVGNAIKFTDAGEVVIKATAADGSFHLSVRDTGPGISAADQTKLFQEFQQADNAITKKKGGTGLGLAISKERDILPLRSISPD
jgi:GAF domain-containing protein